MNSLVTHCDSIKIIIKLLFNTIHANLIRVKLSSHDLLFASGLCTFGTTIITQKPIDLSPSILLQLSKLTIINRMKKYFVMNIII